MTTNNDPATTPALRLVADNTGSETQSEVIEPDEDAAGVAFTGDAPPPGELVELQKPLVDAALHDEGFVVGATKAVRLVNWQKICEQAETEMRKRHALVIEGGREVIYNLAAPGQMPDFWTIQAFKTRYQNETYYYVEGPETQKLEPAKAFLGARGNRRPFYTGTCWEPGPIKKAPAGKLNLWTGFPPPGEPGRSWVLLKQHIWKNIVCRNAKTSKERKYLYRWILMWMADILQFPGRKLGSAIVLRGRQGVGKSVLFDILSDMLGEGLAFIASESGQLVGTFNSQIDGKLLVISEEAVYSGDPAGAGALKQLITGDKLAVNRKHAAMVVRANYIRVAILGNDSWLIPTDQSGDARRFLVCDVGAARREDSTYFGAIRRQMDDEGGKGAMAAELLALDPTKWGMAWNDLRKAPNTAARKVQASHSLKGAPAILKQIVEDGVIVGKLGDQPFAYTLNETTETLVRTVHLNTVLRPSGPTYGSAARAPKQALIDVLGTDVELPNPVMVAWSACLDEEGAPTKEKHRCYSMPPLEVMRARIAERWA